jgi:16S rRNA (adenine1518-N6/adenine1519-N6)-dimethyltransferase
MRKKFGQNFLVNPAVRNSLLDKLAAEKGEKVWEVGPGLGAMTKGLLERGLQVTAFEIDSGFSALLREVFGGQEHFSLIEGDVLKTWKDQPKDEDVYLLGNLPYNIGAALLADFIEQGRFFKRIVVTVQREVARRMAAKPGTEDYSSFSVLCSSVYTVTPLMVIGGHSFYPPPHVDSQGVLLEKRTIEKIYPKLFYQLVRSLFASRRKTIKNNLSRFISSRIMKEEPDAICLKVLEKCGISPSERAENLDIGSFSALAEILEGICR